MSEDRMLPEIYSFKRRETGERWFDIVFHVGLNGYDLIICYADDGIYILEDGTTTSVRAMTDYPIFKFEDNLFVDITDPNVNMHGDNYWDCENKCWVNTLPPGAVFFANLEMMTDEIFV